MATGAVHNQDAERLVGVTQPSAEVNAQRKAFQKEVYKTGLFRQLTLWILFLLFLPFFISMPVMIFMRLTHQQFIDASALAFIFLLSILAMTFIVLQIVTMGRIRIELAEDALNFSVPTWRGPTPFSPVVEKNITYNTISDIEHRGELYSFWGVLGVNQVSSIRTQDGERYVLGYLTENDTDAPIPFQKISKNLSERINKPIAHKGCVHAGTQIGALFKGTPAWDEPPLAKGDVDKIRKRSENFIKYFIIGFFVLLLSVIGMSLYPYIMELFATSPN